MLARSFVRLAAAGRAAAASKQAVQLTMPLTTSRTMATDIPKEQHIRLNLGVEFPNFDVSWFRTCETLAAQHAD